MQKAVALLVTIFFLLSLNYQRVPTANAQNYNWGLQFSYSTWEVTIRNVVSTPKTYWVWEDCYQSYQPSCANEPAPYQVTINPGETKRHGPGRYFCYEGQIDIGTYPGEHDLSARSFTIANGLATGINGACNIPTPTPAPATPTPTPANANCFATPARECVRKSIGMLTSFGNFVPASTIETGTDYWVMLEVKGRTENNGGSLLNSIVTINEQINSTYFEIIPPEIGTSFKITNASGSDITSTLCPTLSACIPTSTPQNMTINLGRLAASNRYFVYFKVIPHTESGGPVNVNSAASSATYDGNTDETVSIINTQANVGEQISNFIIVADGNIYSNSNNTSFHIPLESDQTLINGVGIAYARADINLGEGKVSNPEWPVKNYPIELDYPGYDTKYNEHANSIQQGALPTIQGPSRFDTGKNMYMPAPVTTPYSYKVSGVNWRGVIGNTNESYQPIIFIPGDLYIDEEFSVLANGKNVITFYIKGNLGISPTVEKIEGLYFVDGKIDSVCDSSIGFNVSKQCAGNSSSATPLNLQGLFYTLSGFNLDRAIDGSPSEIFSYRPDMILASISVHGVTQQVFREVHE